MLCAHPIKVVGVSLPVACGRCRTCRINRRKFWMGRLLLEARAPGNHFFVTLTHDEWNIPRTDSGMTTLRFDVLQGFLKRYRKRYGPVRYFAVGEYGDESQRAHYHLVLFNQPPGEIECRCNRAWQWRGWVSVGLFNVSRARYVAAYTTKKLQKGHEALGDRCPEFARMSKDPPLGHEFIKAKVKQLLTKDGCLALVARNGDVPNYYRIDGSWYPIGKYWRDYMRDAIGWSKIPELQRQSRLPYEQVKEEWERKVAAFEVSLLEAQKADIHIRASHRPKGTL